jgi:hypothetical protein
MTKLLIGSMILGLALAVFVGIAPAAVAADPPAPPAAPKADAPKVDKAKAEMPKAPSEAAVAAGKKIDWAKMDTAAKKKYMKTTVLPTMKKLFVAFDKKRYSAMNCTTCHGKQAVEKNELKMPSAELPKLPQPTDRAGFMALAEKKPEAAKFMGTQVKPTMAALLGKPEWSETAPDGFGCYGCHTKEEAAAPPAAAPPAGAPPAGAKPGAAAPAAPAKPGAPAPAPAKGW